MIIKRSSNNIKLIESKLPAEWKKFRKVQKEVNSKYKIIGALFYAFSGFSIKAAQSHVY